MSERVYISIVGECEANGESDRTEMVTEGDYVFRGGKHLLRYKESVMEGEAESSTVLKIGDDTVTMTRSGVSNTQMIFENGKRHISHYETPVGSFTIGVTADNVNINVGENGGYVDINYMLDINNSMQTSNKLHLNIRKTPVQQA